MLAKVRCASGSVAEWLERLAVKSDVGGSCAAAVEMILLIF